MYRKDVLFRFHLFYHIGECSDRKIIVLRGYRKPLLFSVGQKVTVFQDLILAHRLLGICQKFSPRVSKRYSLVCPVKQQDPKLVLEFMYACRKRRLRNIKSGGRFPH